METQVEKDIAACKEVLAPVTRATGPVGNDIVDVVTKLIDWIKGLNLGDYSDGMLHDLLHFARDYVIPTLESISPNTMVTVVLKMLDAFLAKIDEKIHPVDPTT